MQERRELEVNEVLHGFRVQRRVPLEELQGTLIQMEHESTGLKLIWLDRAEENKTFGIAFKTLPGTTPGCSTFWNIRCCAGRTGIR